MVIDQYFINLQNGCTDLLVSFPPWRACKMNWFSTNLIQCSLYSSFTFIVQCWGSHVQKQDLRIPYESSSDGYPLFLATTYLASAFSNNSVKLLGIMREKNLMAPDSDPVSLLTFFSSVNFYRSNFYWKNIPFQNELTKQYLHVR